MSRLLSTVAAGLALLLAAASPAAAAGSAELPPQLDQVGFEQRLGETVALDVAFTDAAGRRVELREIFGQRPVLLAPVYYECPMLCSLVMNGLVTALRALPFIPGEEMEVVVLSFDAREGAAEAARAREIWLERYDRPETAGGWHFLTGDEASIRAVTDAVGFGFSWDEAGGQFAHSAGLVLLTPDGQVSRYLFGIEYAPRDLRLALVEAAGGAIGGAVDQVLLYCFRYDPATGRYSAAALNLVRLGGVATVLAIALFVGASHLRERRQRVHA